MTYPRLHINTIGDGQDIVLLHGWGVNGAVFEPLKQALSQYRAHYVDLPGFGDSPMIEGDINDWATALSQQLPNNAIWLGWSLGGLVATQIALRFPDKIKALITVASSPCFMAQTTEIPQPWPGIASEVIGQFSTQLHQNLPKTVERFLAIQAMGSETAKADILKIKSLVLAKPLPCEASLQQGLDMLAEVDLRDQLPNITRPWLRVWGKLDGLVPRRSINMLTKNTNMEDVILAKASHSPFISHTNLFIEHINHWLNTLKA
ncbi:MULTISPECIES: pimeloyl-ACP methyl ester esterase BioH [Pseudomonadati]|uniref:Pimeloyl-[acyl-carrier protein] methyl ester esterase n=1 Tax=Shewanella aestuarii TaxID=1028752 RepID=A0ABT0L2R8_9GAMM|nr:pimeloyl-ACP methyl ester esterase BioH [Shewanella aestuarii]MCL1118016.1 pimeloyl-ACP methyl ester esterase BioH [Shewanella aestuarii]GGN79479.1 pimeloyl-[acyl-carrier protein] methyl ester esterase [Shewanella aestuarii]